MGAKPRSQLKRASNRGIPPEAPRVAQILAVLQDHWGHAVCELDHENAYQLLVATILSAQSTDKRVNLVTPKLFRSYPDPSALANADLAELEAQIHSTGFYRMKAKNLIAMARRVVSVYENTIPSELDALITLPGVARKTANVVAGVAFGVTSGIVVDTHVKRVTGLLGLSDQTDPVRIEQQLMEIVPKDKWIDFSQQVIWHGRRICHARRPLCDQCPLAPMCPVVSAIA